MRFELKKAFNSLSAKAGVRVALASASGDEAYQILDQLREDGFKHQQPVAYRVLDFLVARLCA